MTADQRAVDAAMKAMGEVETTHEFYASHSAAGSHYGCTGCNERFQDRHGHPAHVFTLTAEAVAAAVVAAVQGPIKAEALREAAVDVQAVTSGYPNNPRIRSLASIRSWLRARADRIEAQP